MHTTRLRKVGGSVMLAVPPSLLELLHLKAGTSVGIRVDGERLVIEATLKPKYSMTELLATSDYSGLSASQERDWLDAPAVGKEIL
jgi:antitoxin ChpS